MNHHMSDGYLFIGLFSTFHFNGLILLKYCNYLQFIWERLFQILIVCTIHKRLPIDFFAKLKFDSGLDNWKSNARQLNVNPSCHTLSHVVTRCHTLSHVVTRCHTLSHVFVKLSQTTYLYSNALCFVVFKLNCYKKYKYFSNITQ